MLVVFQFYKQQFLKIENHNYVSLKLTPLRASLAYTKVLKVKYERNTFFLIAARMDALLKAKEVSSEKTK